MGRAASTLAAWLLGCLAAVEKALSKMVQPANQNQRPGHEPVGDAGGFARDVVGGIGVAHASLFLTRLARPIQYISRTLL